MLPARLPVYIAAVIGMSLPLGMAHASTSGASNQAPAFSFLRANEDWSRYYNNDYKHVKLNSSGDNWVSFGGHVRYRGEFWRNLGFNDDNDDIFHLARATGHADFHFGEKVRLFTEIKSAGATERDLPGKRRTLDVDTLALQQAFVDYQFTPEARLRLGRQALSFGKQRLVSPLPWGNTLRTWDGVRLDYNSGGWNTAVFATQFVPVRKFEFNQAEDDIAFNGIYSSGVLSKATKTDLYWLNLQNTDDQNIHTLGGRINHKGSGWDLDVEAAAQTGTDAADNDVSAWMLGSELGFSVTSGALKRYFVGLDYGSGDDDLSDDNNGTFNQLFPLGHAYLGFADHIGRRNVLAGNIGLILKPMAKLTTRVQLHTFYKAEKEDAVYNAGGAALPGTANSEDTHIADELDVVVSYAYTKQVKFSGGVSYLMAGDVIEERDNDDDVIFAYWSANYNF
ncbi:alginate export family protein [Bacterioplanoides sp.]|uniref:alginate export family protein n=1 Tax=Bacterioplanoides sp. TaxID=2066072 RepID=UPI003B00A74A